LKAQVKKQEGGRRPKSTGGFYPGISIPNNAGGDKITAAELKATIHAESRRTGGSFMIAAWGRLPMFKEGEDRRKRVFATTNKKGGTREKRRMLMG